MVGSARVCTLRSARLSHSRTVLSAEPVAMVRGAGAAAALQPALPALLLLPPRLAPPSCKQRMSLWWPRRLRASLAALAQGLRVAGR